MKKSTKNILAKILFFAISSVPYSFTIKDSFNHQSTRRFGSWVMDGGDSNSVGSFIRW
jgi:hypothetical protein